MANAHVRANGSVKQAVAEFFDAERRNAAFIEKHRLGLSPDDDLPPYRHQDFPRALYIANEEVAEVRGNPVTRIVIDMITVANLHEEKQKLKEGYFENPARAKEAARETVAA
jgi:hypothetical protein